MKILSIIIPHYNNPQGLLRLLNSIPIRNDLDIIIIDDESTYDNQIQIKEIIRKFKYRFYINNNLNSAGTCRNIGIEKSVGKYLLFADDDDYFFIKNLSLAIDGLYSLATDKIELIYHP